MVNYCSKTLAVQQHRWADVQAEIAKVNPTFAAIVNAIDPPKECCVYRARYHYGDEVVKQGRLYLPKQHSRELVPLHSTEVETTLQTALGYNHGSNPMALSLHRNFEIFIPVEHRVVPFSLLTPGSLMGIWRILDLAPASHMAIHLWHLTAGARSVFMLPKISETLSHARLKKEFHFTYPKPANMLEHWEVFREMARGSHQTDAWFSELLFFPQAWVDHLNDPAWLPLKAYLLNYAWQGAHFWRNQFVWNLTFSRIQALHRLKPQTHVNHTVQHAFSVATGAVPGFQPAGDETCAPIKFLQEAYINVYQLRSYAPIIMQPANFQLYHAHPDPVYLSLHYPTAVEFTHKLSERSSTIVDLSECHALTHIYLSELANHTLNLAKTPLEEMAQTIQFDFFHAESGQYANIHQSIQLPKEDPRFLKGFPTAHQEFPKNSSFVKGLIRISKKEKPS